MLELLIQAGIIAVVFTLLLLVAIKKYPSRSTVVELTSTNKDQSWVNQIFDLNTKWNQTMLHFFIPIGLLILPLLFILTILEIIKVTNQ